MNRQLRTGSLDRRARAGAGRDARLRVRARLALPEPAARLERQHHPRRPERRRDASATTTRRGIADAWAVATAPRRATCPQLEAATRAFVTALFDSTLPARGASTPSASNLAVVRSTTCFRLEGGRVRRLGGQLRPRRQLRGHLHPRVELRPDARLAVPRARAQRAAHRVPARDPRRRADELPHQPDLRLARLGLPPRGRRPARHGRAALPRVALQRRRRVPRRGVAGRGAAPSTTPSPSGTPTATSCSTASSTTPTTSSSTARTRSPTRCSSPRCAPAARAGRAPRRDRARRRAGATPPTRGADAHGRAALQRRVLRAAHRRRRRAPLPVRHRLLSDQLLGQLLAHVVGLGHLLPRRPRPQRDRRDLSSTTSAATSATTRACSAPTRSNDEAGLRAVHLAARRAAADPVRLLRRGVDRHRVPGGHPPDLRGTRRRGPRDRARRARPARRRPAQPLERGRVRQPLRPLARQLGRCCSRSAVRTTTPGAATLSFAPAAARPDLRAFFTTGTGWGRVELDDDGVHLHVDGGELDLRALRRERTPPDPGIRDRGRPAPPATASASRPTTTTDTPKEYP